MICIATDPGTGGTFLTWSLHYLAGHDQYFLQEKSFWANLVSNPLNNNNSHKFIPNQPNRKYQCSVDQFRQFVKELEATPTDTFHTLYFHQFDIKETTEAALEHINKHSNKTIVVDSSDHKLYHCGFRKRVGIPVAPGKIIVDNKSIQDYVINKYFADSVKVWKDLQLTNVWDVREFLSLNFRPFLVDSIYKNKLFDKNNNHYHIKAVDLWTMFDFTLESLFDYLEINPDKQRLISWQEIYFCWRKVHQQRLLFATYFDNIIDAILNNYNINLLRFDLDIEQEAAIQHVLIYKHNLNLKTWQLNKFIDTKQLHNLLEPNIHPLSS